MFHSLQESPTRGWAKAKVSTSPCPNTPSMLDPALPLWEHLSHMYSWTLSLHLPLLFGPTLSLVYIHLFRDSSFLIVSMCPNTDCPRPSCSTPDISAMLLLLLLAQVTPTSAKWDHRHTFLNILDHLSLHILLRRALSHHITLTNDC